MMIKHNITRKKFCSTKFCRVKIHRVTVSAQVDKRTRSAGNINAYTSISFNMRHAKYCFTYN